MNYGMQISASGALAALYRQDVHSNNLANASTAGFKPVVPTVRQRDDVRTEDGVHFLPSNALLERLGGGVQMAPNHVRFEQGAITPSNNPLDVAIRGEGFLVVRANRGEAQDRMTRDGRLTLDREGRLVRASDGLPVLDTAGRTITLPRDGHVTIDERGTIRVSGQEAATLQFVAFDPGVELRPEGDGLFSVHGPNQARRLAGNGTILQGMVEQSAVDEFDAMMKIAEAGRAFGANLTLIGYHDRVLEQAIGTLGRVMA
ncbi:MAG: flagellar hook basal-body protein [Phycisphaeraceae bacterium]|nr:flagellar hook basal-body protein [Phycisphaeraceae bacterium]MCW5754091.1 flagellar hook basal-body protein [Phycisphaeraceae bacterium]